MDHLKGTIKQNQGTSLSCVNGIEENKALEEDKRVERAGFCCFGLSIAWLKRRTFKNEP